MFISASWTLKSYATSSWCKWRDLTLWKMILKIFVKVCLCNDVMQGSNGCDLSLCISLLTLETETFFSFKFNICNPEILWALLRASSLSVSPWQWWMVFPAASLKGNCLSTWSWFLLDILNYFKGIALLFKTSFINNWTMWSKFLARVTGSFWIRSDFSCQDMFAISSSL